jgi:hypothetical protein
VKADLAFFTRQLQSELPVFFRKLLRQAFSRTFDLNRTSVLADALSLTLKGKNNYPCGQ